MQSSSKLILFLEDSGRAVLAFCMRQAAAQVSERRSKRCRWATA